MALRSNGTSGSTSSTFLMNRLGVVLGEHPSERLEEIAVEQNAH
jgi:hypothetical protein